MIFRLETSSEALFNLHIVDKYRHSLAHSRLSLAVLFEMMLGSCIVGEIGRVSDREYEGE